MLRQIKGFSLIELIITVLVLAVLAAVGSSTIYNGVQAYYAVDGALTTLAKLRYSTERIAQEFRETDYSAGAYLVSATFPQTSNDSITFTNRDGVDVTLNVSGSTVTITYSTVAGTYTLTDQLSDLTFNFYMPNGASDATSASDVSVAEINLTLTLDGTSYAQRTRIGLRNMQ